MHRYNSSYSYLYMFLTLLRSGQRACRVTFFFLFNLFNEKLAKKWKHENFLKIPDNIRIIYE
uniref:Uncharacterized protein n=1 Tax=Fagonia indica TaxID=66629 RepID=A0A6C0UA98_9ROSI|nr:hypothetical protein [Fagonia indica]